MTIGKINLPLPDHWGATSVNKQSLGAERTELWTGGGDKDIKEALGDESTVASVLTKNKVDKTEAGHIMEMDDTRGNQRIIFRHANQKTGIELRPDGSILISTPNNKVEIVGEDHTVLVEGDGKLVYKGNLDISVTGDLNIDCQNMNVNVRGNKKEEIEGSQRTKIGANLDYKVTGTFSTLAAGAVSSTFLGGYEVSTKGLYSNNVQGSATFSSSGTTAITSETLLNLAANNANLLANDVTVGGGTGTIGGENVKFGGKELLVSGNIKAAEAHLTGDLIVDEELKVGSWIWGSLRGTAYAADTTDNTISWPSASGASLVTVTDPTVTVVTAAQFDEFLDPDNNSEAGINSVVVDEGDHIKNEVDKTTANGGVTKKKISTPVVRNKLRNPTNRTNTTFITKGIENNAICTAFNNPTPPGVGRSTSFDDAKSDPQALGPNTAYIPSRKTEVQTIPDPAYNPKLRTPITSRTKLSPGVSMSKFLGGEDGGTNWDFIRSESKQISIATYYYMHAQILKTIQEDNTEFKNYRLVVSEGLYRKGPTEVIETGSIADLRSQGRAVVYDLLDNNGESATEKMYDLAVYWKDSILYEKMILDYDTIDCDKPLSARIIIILPEIDDNFNAVYPREIETRFNDNKLTQDELVEVLPVNPNTQYLDMNTYPSTTTGDGFPHHRMNQTLNTPDVGYVSGLPTTRMSWQDLRAMNGKLNPANLVIVQPVIPGVTHGSGPMMLTPEYAAKWKAMKAAAAKDGITLQITSAYRSYTYQYLAHKEHKAANPSYPIAPAGTSNHGYGMAVDIAGCTANSTIWNWMKANGPRFGFKQGSNPAREAWFKSRDAVHFSFNGE